MTPFVLTDDPANRASVIGAVVSAMAALDPTKRYSVEIREESRSAAQNRYWWKAIVGGIVTFMRDHHGRDYSEDAIHETLKELFVPCRVEQLAKREVKIYRSTTKLTKREFSDLIEHAMRWAAEFGCVLESPDWDWQVAAERPATTTEAQAA